MGLETVTHISDLVATNPTSSDPKSQGDDHLRNIKTALVNDFTGFTGAVCVTGTDSGAVNVYTLTPTNALVAYGTRMAAVFSPTITNTGAATLNISTLGAKAIKRIDGTDVVSGDLVAGSIYVAAYDGTNFRLLAPTKNYVDQLAFSTVLPAQTGNAGKFITTDGTNASWGSPLPAQAGNANKFLKTDGTAASWAVVTPPQVVRDPRTSNTMLAATDSQKLIDITSGTFTQTFDACATLGNGWYVWLHNAGTGDITLDPNLAETIDGLTSFVMYPGEARLVQCDGSALHSAVIHPFCRAFTTTSTFTKPPGYALFGARIWSGGGAGAKDTAANAPAGGAGGGCGDFIIPASTVGATETVTVAAGGASVTINSRPGNDGGNSSFGSLATVYSNGAIYGGSIVSGLTVANPVAWEGSSPRATPANAVWGGGAPSTTGDSNSSGSIYGAGAGGSISSGSVAKSGGTSVYAGNGGAASVTGNGTDGVAPGGGGGAALNGVGNSGAGARGEVRVWGIC